MTPLILCAALSVLMSVTQSPATLDPVYQQQALLALETRARSGFALHN